MSGRHRAEPAPAGPTASSAPADAPLALSILRGDPTPEEVAAITAVLSSAAAESADHGPDVPATAWNRSPARLRQPLAPGPGAWRGFAG